MIRKITYNYVKLLFFLIYPIVAFGISFYFCIFTENDDEPQVENKLLNVPDVYEKENRTEFAESFLEASIKTLIMSTGEFDFSDLVFKSRSIWILYMLFVFVVFLVGMNLLNGIAISDIQEIQKDAGRYHVRQQVNCLVTYDKLEALCDWVFCSYIWGNCQNFVYCFPDKVIELDPHTNIAAGGDTYVRCSVHERQTFIGNSYTFIKQMSLFNSKPAIDKGLLNTMSCEEGRSVTDTTLQTKVRGHKYFIPAEYITSAKQIVHSISKEEKRKRINELLRNLSTNDSLITLTLDAIIKLM